MPVTVVPSSHLPRRHDPKPVESLEGLLQRSCPDAFVEGETRIVASSFAESPYLCSSSSSFIRSAIEAWGRHAHLIIRPDDIWFTILVQMNFFMEKNAESLRHLFVSHDDTKELEIWANEWNEVIDLFRPKLQQNIKTPWLSDWISPGFSTSTDDDERTATILMMGMMKSFFDYSGGIICGIPSITVMGNKEDWQRLVAKTERLVDFGSEPSHYARRMAPILSRIIRTFDDPTVPDVREFWDQMVHAKVRHSRGCGEPPTQYIVSGWILGFFYWDATGRVQEKFSTGIVRGTRKSLLKLDDIAYAQAALEDIPTSYAKARFTMWNDHGGSQGGPFKGWVLAGSIGKIIYPGAPEECLAKPAHDTAQRCIKEEDELEIPTENSTMADRKSGFLARLLSCLSCFQTPKDADEQHPIPASSTTTTATRSQRADGNIENSSEKHNEKDQLGHTTIQPQAGWFLFGPDKDVTPFFESEEVWGPTVDAIESCDGIEHYEHVW